MPDMAPISVRCKTRLTIASLDGRTAAARRARDLVAALTADLGGDLSAAQAELVQRAAMLGAFIENAEAGWLAGHESDVSTWLAAIDRQRRTLMALGLDRVAKAVPSWDEVIRNLP